MIKLLRLKNIAVVPSVELALPPGFSVLTGETGAGKSIVVDSIGLLLGARATPELIRTGEETAVAEAAAEVPGVAAVLAQHGLPADGDELILRRELNVSGKGRASVNGALVPVSVLRELAPALAALHGQHQHQGLLDPATHLELVDAHARVAPAERESLAADFACLRRLAAELEALRRDRREWERRRETLEFQAVEIERARLDADEEDELRRERVLQANAERLATLAGEAWARLYEDEAAVLPQLAQVFRRVEELAGIDPRFAPYLEARGALRAQIEDLALFLRDYREGIAANPARLDEIESRLALIERLKRKYGATLAEVLAFAERSRAELAGLGSPEQREAQLGAERERVAARYLAAARSLSERRREAAPDLARRVEQELRELAMERGRFDVRFEPEDAGAAAARPELWSPRGLEQAEFLLSPNPGEELRPLARIASGGELSRVLLALESVASLEAQGTTLVFDEVDAGIGGRVAEVVGRKLKALAARHQVLCITHLPQIASLADHHFVVSKRVERGRTLTEVEELAGERRVEELARMLGGEAVTETARRHARELVRQARS